jgi:hypothetical protein
MGQPGTRRAAGPGLAEEDGKPPMGPRRASASVSGGLLQRCWPDLAGVGRSQPLVFVSKSDDLCVKLFDFR